jgi:hypothetical protein
MKSTQRKPHTTSLVLLLVSIFVFWWGISLLAQPTAVPAMPAPEQIQPPLVVHETISGGTHTYSGTFDALPCVTFGSGVRYSAANGSHVSVLLITEPVSAACAQAAGTSGTKEPFSVSIKLTKGTLPLFDGVFLNGSSIPAQLVEGN